MKSRKEALIQSQNKIKDSLEDQITDIQKNFTEIGKKALLIGSSLAAVYGLIRLINGTGKKKKLKKAIGQDQLPNQIVEVKKVRNKEPLLSSALKEQAIVFLLGVATQKLAKFMTALEKEESTDGTK
jgi:hypothetical protein